MQLTMRQTENGTKKTKVVQTLQAFSMCTRKEQMTSGWLLVLDLVPTLNPWTTELSRHHSV